MWQPIPLLQVCKIENNYHVTSNTLNVMLWCIRKLFWDSKKMVRNAKAWKSKLTLWSLHVYTSICFLYILIIGLLFLPQRTLAAHCKTLFLVTAFYPIYDHPESVSADPMASVSVALPLGGWWAWLFHPWKCWGSFQPRWPSCWSCLRVVLFCFAFFSPKLANFNIGCIQGDVVWAKKKYSSSWIMNYSAALKTSHQNKGIFHSVTVKNCHMCLYITDPSKYSQFCCLVSKNNDCICNTHCTSIEEIGIVFLIHFLKVKGITDSIYTWSCHLHW